MKTTAKRITVGAAALSLFLFADLSAGIADTTVQPSPLQPVKVEPVSALALSVTSVL